MFRYRPSAIAIAFIVLALHAPPSNATTFLRQSLAELTRQNELVVHGRVVGVESRWAQDRSIIVTDVRLAPREVLKGSAASDGAEFTFTILGGAVDDLMTVESGGPLFVLGSDYVIFLSHRALPGEGECLTIPDLAQGVFNVIPDPAHAGLRAVSQAVGEPMVPDAAGELDAPGGTKGLPFDQMTSEIRSSAQVR